MALKVRYFNVLAFTFRISVEYFVRHAPLPSTCSASGVILPYAFTMVKHRDRERARCLAALLGTDMGLHVSHRQNALPGGVKDIVLDERCEYVVFI